MSPVVDAILFFALVILWVRNWQCAVRVKQAAQQAQAIARGDLHVPNLVYSWRGDIGLLAHSLNQMKRRIAGTVGQIAALTQQVGSAAEEISTISAQQARRAEEQQEQTAQVATAMEEMSATVVEVARNASEAAAAAKEANALANQGREVMTQSRAKMERIARMAQASAQTIRALGKRSDQIGEIVGVINDIADQTDLLALNAAIEAARAGEQGRGFAVVADEVRKLAERTTKATREIADTIKTIQEETREAVREIEAGTQEIATGVELAEKAHTALGNIVAAVEKAARMIQQIATATEEQSTAAEEVSRSVEQISTTSTEAARGIRQTAETCQGLSRLTSQLQVLTDQFQLDGAGWNGTQNGGAPLPVSGDLPTWSPISRSHAQMRSWVSSLRSKISSLRAWLLGLGSRAQVLLQEERHEQ